MIVLHLALLIDRLAAAGAAGQVVAQGVVEAFVTEMDDAMREMGIGDLTVPKKVKRAAAGLYERTIDYRAALSGSGGEQLPDALARHFAGRADAGSLKADDLADYVRRVVQHLAAQKTQDLVAGRVRFPAVAVAERGEKQ